MTKPSSDKLRVENLSVSFEVEGVRQPAVRDVSFSIKEGEILGLVGESGSGKSVTGMSIMRLVPCPPGKIESGKIFYQNKELLSLPIEEMRQLRGSEIAVIFQEPMTAMSPLMTVGAQLAETATLHNPELNKEEAWELAIEWLGKVGIPEPSERAQAYPFQFSGGMRQRAMIAMALMLEPKLIIADEPTTALDVTLQQQIFELILKMKAEDSAVLFITHDMGVVWELCDRVLVMKDGSIVERGETTELFAQPKVPYSKALLSAVPRLTDQPLRELEPSENSPLIEVKNLKTWFPIKRGVFARTVDHVKAVDGVSLSIMPGETVGLVGESGSGKSTLGRSILGLDPVSSGSILFHSEELVGKSASEMRPLRRNLQMIFQDPQAALNPRLTVLETITEGLAEHGLLSKEDSRREIAAHWLEEVGLKADHLRRYPHEFSGGQRQRICIARAIAVKPEFMVCDEAVSALDVTIQAQIIDLLMELREKLSLSYLFISHDLSVVKRIADSVLVMKSGKIVERGTAAEVIENPQHQYTQKLVKAVPIPGDLSRRAAHAL